MDSLAQAAGLVILGMVGEKFLRKNDTYREKTDKPVDAVCNRLGAVREISARLLDSRKKANLAHDWIGKLTKEEQSMVELDFKLVIETYGKSAKTDFIVSIGNAVQNLGGNPRYKECINNALEALNDAELQKIASSMNEGDLEKVASMVEKAMKKASDLADSAKKKVGDIVSKRDFAPQTI